MKGETSWRLTSVGKPFDRLNVRLTVSTDAESVVDAIEAAAAKNKIVLEREGVPEPIEEEPDAAAEPA